MRSCLMVLPALLVATPAFAQDAAPPPSLAGHDMATAARALADPQVQRAAAALIGVLSDTVLATKVGPLASVDRSVRPNDTLGSVAERRDPGFHDRMARDTQATVGTIGNVAGAAAGMATELNATAERLRAALAAVHQ